jgi:two-component system phosphate regulon response regulator OmpR
MNSQSSQNTDTNTTHPATVGHSAKIMVVDDDVRLRDLLRRYLTEQGFSVVTAESAPAMNKLWLRERYDLLVLDLMLPGEDGLSICRRLRGAGDERSSCSPPGRGRRPYRRSQ